MTQVLTIGKTEIPYVVRYSERARRKRIVVTPDGVEVVAPSGSGAAGVTAFVNTKRRWMFDAVREIAAKQGKLLTQHYASGAKLQYRGRWLMLDVESAKVETVQVSCRSKFHVLVPRGLKGTARLRATQAALDEWLRERALRDLQGFVRAHGATLGVEAAGCRITDAKHAWGTCGKDDVIRVHWRLIQAPKVAMEYVAAHEVAHLLHRNHSAAFWRKLGETMPDWAEAKAMLERWEGEHRVV
jgi:predicted metal-dependent hydrolase